MRVFSFLTAVVLIYFVIGFYVSQNDLTIIPAGIESDNFPGYYDYRGEMNVRSNLSVGSSSVPEIISEAKAAGLDFLILTDTNQMQSIDLFSSYHGNLLVFQEGEYSYLDSRILFLSYDRQPSFPDLASSQVFLADLISKGANEKKEGLVVLAAPFSPNEKWVGDYPSGLNGVEVLNPKVISDKAWIRSKTTVLWSLLMYPFNSRYSFLRLFREPSEEMALWNTLSQLRPTSGYSGADASARAFPFADYLIKFPSYRMSLEIASNHVLMNSELTGNFAKDKQKIYGAFKAGNFYTSLDLLGNPKGFMALLKHKDKEHLMGTSIDFAKGMTIWARLPHRPRGFFEIAMLRNGERVATSNETEISYDLKEPGVYRLVVRVAASLPIPDGKKWIGWIYTNPFYVN
jgi:hypothetical protein